MGWDKTNGFVNQIKIKCQMGHRGHKWGLINYTSPDSSIHMYVLSNIDMTGVVAKWEGGCLSIGTSWFAPLTYNNEFIKLRIIVNLL